MGEVWVLNVMYAANPTDNDIHRCCCYTFQITKQLPSPEKRSPPEVEANEFRKKKSKTHYKPAILPIYLAKLFEEQGVVLPDTHSFPTRVRCPKCQYCTSVSNTKGPFQYRELPLSDRQFPPKSLQ